MSFQRLSFSMILIVLSLVHINASKYSSVRQAINTSCPPVDLCGYVTCANGQCIDDKTTRDCFRCQCPVGLTGLLCESSISTPNGCDPPCQNGGQCQLNAANAFICVCPADYSGSQCETSILATHPCVTMPGTVCQNGGTCTINGAGFLCNCPTGFSGVNCQTQDTLTTCDSNTCGTHGTCRQIILPNSAPISICVCDSQWTGTVCDVSLAGNCPIGFCQSGGVCLMNGNTPYCACPSTHTGQQCETLISPLSTTTTAMTPTGTFTATISTSTLTPTLGSCSSNPCLNSGTCFNNGNTFVCACPSTHTGQQCEISISPLSTTTTAMTPTGTFTATTSTSTLTPTLGACSSNPCLNGGTCFNTGNTFVCLCQSQYSGQTCSLQNSVTTPVPTTAPGTDACLSNPCNNGGTCYKYSNSFVCVCTTPYTGQTCDMAKTTATPSITTPSSAITCANQPCQNGATCYGTGSSYFCYCGANSNYAGQNCDTPKVSADPNCPLDCSPGYCIVASSGQNPYACMCHGGTLTPTSCSSK